MGGLGPGNNGVLAGGRGAHPGTAVGGSRGNSSSSNNGQFSNTMKLSDHIQHASQSPSGEPAMIGGGGFNFY